MPEQQIETKRQASAMAAVREAAEVAAQRAEDPLEFAKGCAELASPPDDRSSGS